MVQGPRLLLRNDLQYRRYIVWTKYYLFFKLIQQILKTDFMSSGDLPLYIKPPLSSSFLRSAEFEESLRRSASLQTVAFFIFHSFKMSK
mmetsp:Transcript_23710/g.33978  ORF Transcript_23710/g.33978 Transcript_23710/m.33978 type:complete len:89 (+) Transcript_23710:967-1233(+)